MKRRDHPDDGPNWWGTTTTASSAGPSSAAVPTRAEAFGVPPYEEDFTSALNDLLMNMNDDEPSCSSSHLPPTLAPAAQTRLIDVRLSALLPEAQAHREALSTRKKHEFILVRILGVDTELEFDPDDIMEVFARYGYVYRVHFAHGGHGAVIVEMAKGSADRVIRCLNNQTLRGLGGVLSVEEICEDHPLLMSRHSGSSSFQLSTNEENLDFRRRFPQSAVDLQVTQQAPQQLSPARHSTANLVSVGGGSSSVIESPANNDQEYLNLFLDLYSTTLNSPPRTPPQQPASVNPTKAECFDEVADAATSVCDDKMIRKWTARYEVQIDPLEPFQVTRRIIGTRGVNMKRINQLTDAKLRLRGRGSGYLEGSNRQEADDPLHLCISSTDGPNYRLARKLAEELLLEIYKDYEKWRHAQNLPPVRLQLKIKETLLPNKSGGGEGSAVRQSPASYVSSPFMAFYASPLPPSSAGGGIRQLSVSSNSM